MGNIYFESFVYALAILAAVGATVGLFMGLGVGAVWRGDVWRAKQAAAGAVDGVNAGDHVAAAFDDQAEDAASADSSAA